MFYNGSKLASNEFTATNGTTFVLATACQANDIVQAVVSVTGGGIGGSGTTNYISKWSASGVLTNSLIFDNGTNVGIGTTSPIALLNIYGTTHIQLQNATTGATASDGTRIQLSGSDLQIINREAANIILYTSDTERMRITSTGNVGIGTSSPGTRLDVSGTTRTSGTFNAFDGTRDVYLNPGADFGLGALPAVQVASNHGLQFATNNGLAMFITSGRNVGIGPSGAASSAVRLVVQGSDATSSNYAFIATNNAGSTLLAIRNDGLIDTGTRSASPYNNTYGNAANVYIGADGVMGRSTSSLKYKENVLDYNKGLAEVMQLRPVSYTSKNPQEEGQTFAGLIAEEVHDLGLTEFVQYAEDGSPDALAYQNMIALLTKAIQELKAEVDTLRSKVQ